jgi:nucleoid-associated protein YgaU
MLRKNLMSALVAAVAAGAVLVGYNAFFHSNVSQRNTATSRLSAYLSLDKGTQESKSAENNVVGTDNVQSATATPNVAVTDTPAPSTADSSMAMPGVTAHPDTTMSASTEQSGKAASTYVVKEGDTYGCIAEKYYGSYEHYSDIMASNSITQQGFGEYSLYVGATLVLPAIAKENLKPASSLCQ